MNVSLDNKKVVIKLSSGDDFYTIIEKIKKHLSPYEYNPQTKLWTTERMNLLIFKHVFKDDRVFYEKDVLDLINKQDHYVKYLDNLKNTEYDKPMRDISLELFKHQMTAINFQLNETNSGLFDEQGLGKTLTTISTLQVLFDEKKIENIVVICPNTLKYNWKVEIDSFSSLTSAIIEGSKKQKIELLDENANVYITNFESLIIRKTKKSKVDAKSFQEKFEKIITEKTCIVIDEAHRIKSGNSKISKFLRKVGKLTNYKYVLTGTPIANKPEDIFYLFMFLDGGKLLGTNYYKFLKQYCILGNSFSDFAIVGYKNLDKLKFLVGLKSLRRLKKNVQKNLPQKIFQNRIIELSHEHKKCYENLKKEILTIVKEDNSESIIKSCLMRLIQCSSNPRLLQQEIDSSKIKELDNLLEEHIERSGNKVIIWTNFINNFPLLLERYKKYNPLYINGSVAIDQRQKNILEFQNVNKVKLIICNPQAASTGITLTASSVAIYLDRGFNLVDYLQSVDRIHNRTR